jgi:hypothetical protein
MMRVILSILLVLAISFSAHASVSFEELNEVESSVACMAFTSYYSQECRRNDFHSDQTYSENKINKQYLKSTPRRRAIFFKLNRYLLFLNLRV